MRVLLFHGYMLRGTGSNIYNFNLARALARLGVPDYRRHSTRITARMPTAEEAALLDQARSRPVLVSEALNVDAAGEPVELSIACYAAGRVQILVES